MKKGSIACRKDPLDQEEWLFCFEEELDLARTKDPSTPTQVNLRKGWKLPAGWNSSPRGLARRRDQGRGSTGLDGCAAYQRTQEAASLEGQGSDEEPAAETASKETGKDEQLVEAEVLFEVGSAMPRKEALLRGNRW